MDLRRLGDDYRSTSLSLTLDRVLDHHFHRETASPLPEGEGDSIPSGLRSVDRFPRTRPVAADWGIGFFQTRTVSDTKDEWICEGGATITEVPVCPSPSI